MLNTDPTSITARLRSAPLVLALLLPVIVSACVNVTSETGADATAEATTNADASPTLPPLASRAPIATPEPTPEPVEAEVIGFLPNWQIDDAVKSLDPELLTVLAFHGLEANGEGRLVSKKADGNVPSGWRVMESDAFIDLKDSLQADGVKVVPVIQRMGWTEGMLERTEQLLTKKRVRRDLANRIAAFVEARGFDGANLDFEPIPEELSDEYSAFVRELRAALDKIDPEYHLSVDVVSSLEGYDLAALTADDAADLALIMGYEYKGDGAGVTGSTAPLTDPSGRDLSTSVASALEQVSGDKLVLGLPWYGRAWSTEADKARASTMSGQGIDASSTPSYAIAVELAAQNGRRYQPDQASAWTAYPDQQCPTCPAVWRQVWYDDPDSFGAKIDHALEQDLAGVGIWALGHEAGRDEMWWALRDRLRPRVDTSPPNGSASLDPETFRDQFDGLDAIAGVASLRLFPSGDTTSADVAMLTRIGLDDEVDGEGRLVNARTYPAVDRVEFPLADEATGGSDDNGPRSIHIQWRDLAGNWSDPLVIEAYAVNPERSRTPADL